MKYGYLMVYPLYFQWFITIFPMVYQLKMAIEIVDLPTENRGSFQFAMLVYQRVYPKKSHRHVAHVSGPSP
jgi:hypothetical protein